MAKRATISRQTKSKTTKTSKPTSSKLKRDESSAVAVASERVMVIPADTFHMIVGNVTEPTFIGGQGGIDMAMAILNDPDLHYIDRDVAEEDESFKQIIPYVYLMRGREIYRYSRTEMCGESRLRGKSSIGIGGHVEEAMDGKASPEAYAAAVNRELSEEIGLVYPEGANPNDHIVGLLYDPTEAVGRVHVGIVHQLKIHNTASVDICEDALADGRFQHVRYAKQQSCTFEKWSELTLSAIT